MRRARGPQAACGGFTLVELLVGSVVLCTVLALLFATLWFSVRNWTSAQTRRNAAHTLALVQATLAQQLRQARPLYVLDGAGRRVVAFGGDAERLTYIAPLSRGDDALYLNTLFLAPRAEGRALQLRYTRWQPDLALGGPGADDGEDIELLPRIDALSIAYFGAPEHGGDPAWRSRWSAAQTLPERVHIRITTTDGNVYDWPDLMVCLFGGADCLIPVADRPDVRIAIPGYVLPGAVLPEYLLPEYLLSGPALGVRRHDG